MTTRYRRRVVVAALAAVLAATVALVSTGGPAASEANEAPWAPAQARAQAAGTNHTCAIVTGGRVKCWGNNTSGRLGLGDTAARGDAAGEMGTALPAVDLGFGRTATAITAGAGHTCARLDNGTVKCWGANGNGRLGQGDTSARGDAAGEMGDNLAPVNLGTGRTALAVTAGNNHTCALLDNRQVKCWGNNGSGQLGLGDTNARGDAPGEMGNSLPAVDLGTGRLAVAVSAGNAFTCALLDNATVKCWGDNASGRLGLGNIADRGDAAGEMGNSLPTVSLGTGRTATAITAGDAHACALLDDATVKCWGNNGSGRLGLGNTAARGDAANEMGDNLPAVSLGAGRTATSITAADAHTCALLDNATVKCWGENDFGRLGLGNTADRGDAAGEMGDNLPVVSLGTGRTVVAVTGGGLHTCATLDTGARKCWGRNDIGQLGLGNTNDRGDAAGEMGNSLATVSLGPGRTALAVTGGDAHTCALLDNGRVRCWGDNTYGQLGLGDTNDRGDAAGEMGDSLPFVALGSGRTASAISAGQFHTCALLDDGTIKCWGRNNGGRLGLGDLNHRGDQPDEMGDALPAVDLGTSGTATDISAAQDYTCARLDTGAVKCWGTGTLGRLGTGDTTTRGDQPGEMGDALPAVDLGTGRTAIALDTSATSAHTCAILDDNSLKCWGYNISGPLGLGDNESRGDQPGEMGDNLPAVSLGTGRTATAVTVGDTSTCALLDNGSVKCWGNGNSGLGLGITTNRGDGPGEMGDALPVVALGTGRTATRLEKEGSTTCATLDDATLKCWGFNGSGQLGLGDTSTRGNVPGQMGDALPTVNLGTGRTAAVISGGVSHRCAILDDGTLKCWGFNGSGELGLGDTANRGDAAGEMGDSLPVVDLGSGAPAGVSGTVTSAGSGEPVAGAFVALLRTTDFTVAGGAVADLAGNYVAEAPPGTYAAYAIDPDGRHTAGFFGPPTTLTVTTGLVDADPVLAPRRGSITGKAVETGSGDPIAGAWALALTAGGVPETAAPADAAGNFALPDLSAGNHYVGWVDPTGDHATRFFPSSSDIPGATPVNVTAGGEAEAIGELPAQAGTPGGSALTGTVSQAATGTPLPNVLVLAMHAADFRLARATTTDNEGQYALNLAAGSYKVAFLPVDGRSAMEWYDNAPFFAIADADAVAVPGVADAALSLTTGGIAGMLTDAATSEGIADAWVLAIASNGTIAGTATRPDGGYTISGLAPGTYRVTFVDPHGGRAQEFFDNSPGSMGATPLVVTAGATATADAALG